MMSLCEGFVGSFNSAMKMKTIRLAKGPRMMTQYLWGAPGGILIRSSFKIPKLIRAQNSQKRMRKIGRVKRISTPNLLLKIVKW